MPSKYRAESQVSNKTFQAKCSQVNKKSFLIDAKGKNLGRLAVEVSKILTGKRNPYYTKNQLTGDNVIVINAEKVTWTGNNKAKQKLFRKHSGYPGGLRETPLGEMKKKNPERLFYLTVRNMLPKNKLRSKMLNNFKVYRGDRHPHQAQKPIEIKTLPKV